MSEDNFKSIKPIKKELRPILEEFLAFEEYQTIFKSFAEHMGYKGNDTDRIKQLMFTANSDGDIGFNVLGLNDLFLEFQLIKQLRDKDPYKTLLEESPKSITKIRELVKKILKGKDITEQDLLKIFNYGEKKKTD
jgi:hypothetical protein